MGRKNLTNQQTDVIPQHVKCCYGHFEMPEQSLSSMYFCIIVHHDCVPKQQHPPPKAMNAFIVFRGASNLICMNIIIFSRLSYFFQWYIVPVYQEVTILLDGNGAYSQMYYYAIFQLCA